MLGATLKRYSAFSSGEIFYFREEKETIELFISKLRENFKEARITTFELDRETEK